MARKPHLQLKELGSKLDTLPSSEDALIKLLKVVMASSAASRLANLQRHLDLADTVNKATRVNAVGASIKVNVAPKVSEALSLGRAVVALESTIISHDEVVMISVACLIILFSVQKYGTSKMGLAVGLALFIWFCSLAGIGIYSLVKYDSSVLRAFNPIHMYYFFKRNSTKAWYSLGGCLLRNMMRLLAEEQFLFLFKSKGPPKCYVPQVPIPRVPVTEDFED